MYGDGDGDEAMPVEAVESACAAMMLNELYESIVAAASVSLVFLPKLCSPMLG